MKNGARPELLRLWGQQTATRHGEVWTGAPPWWVFFLRGYSAELFPEAPEVEPCFASCSVWWLLAYSVDWVPWLNHCILCLHLNIISPPHLSLSLYLCLSFHRCLSLISLSVSLKGTLVIALSVHQDNSRQLPYLEILNSITFVKILFPNIITFTVPQTRTQS